MNPEDGFDEGYALGQEKGLSFPFVSFSEVARPEKKRTLAEIQARFGPSVQRFVDDIAESVGVQMSHSERQESKRHAVNAAALMIFDDLFHKTTPKKK